jgi:ligand-binding sensor domain-containing protein
MRRKMGLFALAMWMVFSVAAQKISFEHLSSDLGLSQNMINGIMQDSRGFIWVSTNDGLNRYDGYRFTTFRYDPFDSLSISSNEIISVLEDKLGRFWVATSKGIHLFDREKSVFHVLNTPYGKELSEDPRGGIWQATNKGLMRLTLPPNENSIEKATITYIPLKDSADVFYNTPVWNADGRGFVGGYGKSCYQLYWDSISQQPAGYQLLTDLKDFKKTGVQTNLLPFLETPC